MSLRKSLLEAWSLALGSPAIGDQIRAYPLEATRLGARAAVSDAGHSGILVPLAAGERFHPPSSLRGGQGGVLEAEIATFVDGSARVRTLAVWCRDPALRDAFLAFCEALIERWVVGTPVARALDICHAEFQRLLAGPKRLDTSLLVGLLGELMVVAELVELLPESVLAWGGVRRERQDFRHGRVAIETKTTLRSDIASRKVRISSLDQLQPPDKGRLFLHAIHLERNDGGELSLPTLIKRIEARLEGTMLDEFHAALGPDNRGAGDARTFSVLSRRSYEVRNGFPCLVPEKLVSGCPDPGVGNVQYDLDLGTAEEFAASDETALLALIAEVRAE